MMAVSEESANVFWMKNPNGSFRIFCRNDVLLESDGEDVGAGGVGGGVGVGVDVLVLVDAVVGAGGGVETVGVLVGAGGVEVVAAVGVLLGEEGEEEALLVASSTPLHAALSVSVLVDGGVSSAKITFQERWRVTDAGVSDWSLAWNEPQNICACV